MTTTGGWFESFLKVLAFKDLGTHFHALRVGGYCQVVAKKLGRSEVNPEHIFFAAQLHDIGKVGVPDHILFKFGKLTYEEFHIVKVHSRLGYEILKESGLKAEPYYDMALEIALSHHEQCNGQGYPKGLTGSEIPLAAKIAALADSFDAMVCDRPYKRAMAPEMAFKILKTGLASGKFDRDVHSAFDGSADEIMAVFKEHKGADSAL